MARRVLGLTLGAAGAAAVLGLTLVAGPALAAQHGTAAPAAQSGAEPAGPREDRLVLRLQRACHRIPNLLRRADSLEERLAGGVDTRGSLAWLQARVAAAEAAGETDRAQALQARLTVRQDLQKILPGRVDRLEKARSGICADVAAASAASAAGSTP